MRLPDSFSPYLDPEPIADFFDDLGQRVSTAFMLAIAVHIGLFFVLQARFSMPVIPDEPEPIKVQIISFEPKPEPKPEQKPVFTPMRPSPAQAPTPNPKPKPRPKPKPVPPKPEPKPIPKPIPKPVTTPIPEPIPEPEIVFTPPPVDVMKSEALKPKIVQAPQPLPEPRPNVKIFEPQPVPEPTPIPEEQQWREYIPPKPEPLPEPEPIPEEEQWHEYIPPKPVEEPLPEPEPEPEPIPEEEQWHEYIPPAPTESEEPASGAATKEETPPEPAPPAPVIQEVKPEIIPPKPEPATPATPEPEPEIVKPNAPAIISTAPTILASPDAPTSKAEERRAVPQSQSTPLELILKGAGGKPKGSPAPSSGGGNQGNIPIAGGTRRSNPGAAGWTIAPGSWGKEPGKGYVGMIRDIRCREEGRTHEDCPNYVPQHKGRNAQGLENFGAHAPRGTSTTRGSRAANYGTSSLFGSRGSHSGMAGAGRVGGPPDSNIGLPSTTVLDDVNGFNGQYMGDTLGGSSGGRVRDMFGNSDPAPWTLEPALPAPPREDEDEDAKTLILKPKP